MFNDDFSHRSNDSGQFKDIRFIDIVKFKIKNNIRRPASYGGQSELEVS
jgi:hypothetical protein